MCDNPNQYTDVNLTNRQWYSVVLLSTTIFVITVVSVVDSQGATE